MEWTYAQMITIVMVKGMVPLFQRLERSQQQQRLLQQLRHQHLLQDQVGPLGKLIL